MFDTCALRTDNIVSKCNGGASVAKSIHITFSKAHGSDDNRHIDTYRKNSDSSSVEKIAHTPASPGYDNGKPAVSVPVNKSK